MVTGKAGTLGTAAITHLLYLNHALTRLTAETGLTVSLASKLTTTQEENGEAVGCRPRPHSWVLSLSLDFQAQTDWSFLCLILKMVNFCKENWKRVQ